MPAVSYAEKFPRIAANTAFEQLPEELKAWAETQAFAHRLTLQELSQLVEILLDLQMWGLAPPETPPAPPAHAKSVFLRNLRDHWQGLKAAPNRYPPTPPETPPETPADPPRVQLRAKGELGLGRCPVASPATRCCNLLTLDAVDNCGYACSYCSIQSFFSGREVFFDPDFPRKLAALELDPNETHHIGTGQSSDSLMWGNSHGALEALTAFAREHPNVILELKTKSANVGWLLANPVPRNLLCTWSVNPPTVIAHEERGAATLEQRLEAARKVADKGLLVGFHFHPMVHYDRWREDYTQVIERIQALFSPESVVLLSFGALTYTKSVIKRIRALGQPSQVLKMPFAEANGKLSYPRELKQELFRHAYHAFSPQWREQVFCYLCMEDHSLWEPVFGYAYSDNESLEQAMKDAYTAKIQRAAAAEPGNPQSTATHSEAES